MTKVQRKDMMDHLVLSLDEEAFFDWINDNMDPEDVFSDRKLDDWATTNNYTKDKNLTNETPN